MPLLAAGRSATQPCRGIACASGARDFLVERLDAHNERTRRCRLLAGGISGGHRVAQSGDARKCSLKSLRTRRRRRQLVSRVLFVSSGLRLGRFACTDDSYIVHIHLLQHAHKSAECHAVNTRDTHEVVAEGYLDHFVRFHGRRDHVENVVPAAAPDFGDILAELAEVRIADDPTHALGEPLAKVVQRELALAIIETDLSRTALKLMPGLPGKLGCTRQQRAPLAPGAGWSRVICGCRCCARSALACTRLRLGRLCRSGGLRWRSRLRRGICALFG